MILIAAFFVSGVACGMIVSAILDADMKKELRSRGMLLDTSDRIFELLEKMSKQLERIESNTRPFFLPVPPPSIPPGTHTPPLLGPGYTAPFIGDEITICKHPDGGV